VIDRYFKASLEEGRFKAVYDSENNNVALSVGTGYLRDFIYFDRQEIESVIDILRILKTEIESEK